MAMAGGAGGMALSGGAQGLGMQSSGLGSIGYGLARMGGLQDPNQQIRNFLMKVMGIG